MQRIFFALAAIMTMAASPVLAHTGAGSVSGLAAGFGHPIGGLDHVLAMVAVGVLAAQQGGRSIWLVPAAFVAMMVVGGGLAIAGVPVPFVELGIVGSIVVLGGVIAAGQRLPLVGAMALVGVLAIFHGHAHGTEMPVNASGLVYGIGFALATAMLHAAGIALGLGLHKMASRLAPLAIRAGGGAIAATGAILLLA
ncbi:MAG: urease accessory protein [Hyphomicrobiales bacterium]|nr:MAG: urease accessory protein [Hyphomicrobiales bacterium]